MKTVNCPICGKERSSERFTECPYCGWGYTSWENLYEPDEIDDFNKMTANHARKMLRHGKTVNGEPLPHKKG